MWFTSYYLYLMEFICLEVRSVLGWKASGVSSWKGWVCLGEVFGVKVWGFMDGGF